MGGQDPHRVSGRRRAEATAIFKLALKASKAGVHRTLGPLALAQDTTAYVQAAELGLSRVGA